MKKKFKFKVLGLIFALCCVFAFSICSFNCVEVKATEGDVVEETITEELPELGFFEEYLNDILASALGVLATISAFFILVMKAKKNVIDTLDAFKGGKISQEQANASIKKEIEELKRMKEELFKEFKVGKDHLEETSESVKEYVDNCNKMITNINSRIDNLAESFLLLANNNSTLVRKGVAEEINKRLKGGAGVEKTQKL